MMEIPQGGANGLILAQAGRFGGWSLYEGRQADLYLQLPRLAAVQRGCGTTASGRQDDDSIRVRLLMALACGKGGIGTIFVNGQKVAEGRIEQTQCCFFSAG